MEVNSNTQSKFFKILKILWNHSDEKISVFDENKVTVQYTYSRFFELNFIYPLLCYEAVISASRQYQLRPWAAELPTFYIEWKTNYAAANCWQGHIILQA